MRCCSSLCSTGIYRSGASPSIWPPDNLGIYHAIVCCSSFSISNEFQAIVAVLGPPPVIPSYCFRLSSDFAISKAWATGVTRLSMGFSFVSFLSTLCISVHYPPYNDPDCHVPRSHLLHPACADTICWDLRSMESAFDLIIEDFSCAYLLRLIFLLRA